MYVDQIFNLFSFNLLQTVSISTNSLRVHMRSFLLPAVHAAVLIAVLIAVTSCANAAAAESEKCIFLLPSLANPYWQTVKEGIESGGKEVRINPLVLSATSDQAKEEFLNLCQSAISQSPSIIVVCTTTDTITLQCLREVQKHNIQVAVLDNVIPDEALKKAGVKLSFAIGTDNITVGKTAAQFVAKQNKLPAPKVLILEGVVGNTASNNRVSGFKKGLEEALPTAKIVNSISADWDRLKAVNITSDTLTRTPDLNIVFAANDMMALGAAEAIRLAGKTSTVRVVGVDGVPDARKAIVVGRMTATIAQLPFLIGKRSSELAAQSVRGKLSGKSEKTPLLVLTKSVLESKTDPLLKYVR